MIGEIVYIMKRGVFQAVYRQKMMGLSVLLCYACIAIATTTMTPSRGVGIDAISRQHSNIDRAGVEKSDSDPLLTHDPTACS
jgi:hypothetical protein